MDENISNQTSQLLGKLEVKMDNLGQGNEKLGQKLDEVVKEVNTLKMDVTSIKTLQNAQAQPLPPKATWLTVVPVIVTLFTAVGVIVTIVTLLTKQ